MDFERTSMNSVYHLSPRNHVAIIKPKLRAEVLEARDLPLRLDFDSAQSACKSSEIQELRVDYRAISMIFKVTRRFSRHN